MAEEGADLPRRPRRGAEPGLRRARPDRRRRGVRRRGQGGDHRLASRSGPRSSPATCTTRASPASPPTDIAFARRLGYADQAARRSPSGSTTARVGGAGAPGDGPERPSAGLGARQLQRRVRRGRGRRRAHVLRPWRRRVPDRVGGARRRHRRRRQPGQGNPRLARLVRPRRPSARSTSSSSPVLPEPRGDRPARRARRGGRRVRRTTACRSGRWSRRGSTATRPAAATDLHHPRRPRGRRAGDAARAPRPRRRQRRIGSASLPRSIERRSA